MVAQVSVDFAAMALKLKEAEAVTAELGEELKRLRRASGGAPQHQGHESRRELDKGAVWADGPGVGFPKTSAGKSSGRPGRPSSTRSRESRARCQLVPVLHAQVGRGADAGPRLLVRGVLLRGGGAARGGRRC